jgi:dephospho-CoA kinase
MTGDPRRSLDPRRSPDGPFLIGLTGPIGCGKSTVARMLRHIGGALIDADALTRQVTGPGSEALPAIRARFGDAVFTATGELDRAELARVVFADATSLAELEAIIHPRVRPLVEAAIARAADEGIPFVVVEAIKLVESGLAERCDEVWLVTCGSDVQRQRLLARGMDQADIERRVTTQGPDLADRLGARADRVIDTSGDLETTRERVEDALADALAGTFVGLPLGGPDRPT